MNPSEFARRPFASGVPTVSLSDVGAGGPQAPKDSGAPCVVLGAVQGE